MVKSPSSVVKKTLQTETHNRGNEVYTMLLFFKLSHSFWSSLITVHKYAKEMYVCEIQSVHLYTGVIYKDSREYVKSLEEFVRVRRSQWQTLRRVWIGARDSPSAKSKVSLSCTHTLILFQPLNTHRSQLTLLHRPWVKVADVEACCQCEKISSRDFQLVEELVWAEHEQTFNRRA